MKVFLNGSLVDAQDARISPFDHGLLVGDGVFETLLVYDGVPFAWTRHLERLAHSANGMGLALPEADVIRRAADAVLKANGLTAGRLRVTVTGGPAPLGSERGDVGPTLVVAAAEQKPWPPTETVVVVPWPRNERGALSGLKTISYGENVRALAHAHANGAGEAMFLNTRGDLCEATGSNVFCVHDRTVRTPPATSGCLLGVTRALVLELCHELEIPCEEPALGPDELRESDEAFLTSTTREVQAIARVDGTNLPAAPGPITKKLATAFAELHARDIDP